MKAFLILEDGTVFEGTSIGAEKEVISEIVFNTSMTGYLEILTNPSYTGQTVVMTYPLIGNYGICREDMESAAVCQSAMIVREISRIPSNFRSETDIDSFLKEQGVPGIKGVDTRALTKILREKGTMNGMITTRDVDPSEVLEEIRAYRVKDAVKKVTCSEKKVYPGEGFKVALMNFGAKKHVLESLMKRGCQVTEYPADTTAEEILKDAPDGIMLSNGPGDPKDHPEIIEELKKLFVTNTPIFGTGLGHELMALACGADTEKMKCGHRGSNYPVKDMKNGRVYITTQDHGYVVKEESIDRNIAEVSFLNVNDGTVAGIHYLGKNVQTVQFYPGSRDTVFLYDEFVNMMEVTK